MGLMDWHSGMDDLWLNRLLVNYRLNTKHQVSNILKYIMKNLLTFHGRDGGRALPELWAAKPEFAESHECGRYPGTLQPLVEDARVSLTRCHDGTRAPRPEPGCGNASLAAPLDATAAGRWYGGDVDESRDQLPG